MWISEHESIAVYIVCYAFSTLTLLIFKNVYKFSVSFLGVIRLFGYFRIVIFSSDIVNGSALNTCVKVCVNICVSVCIVNENI